MTKTTTKQIGQALLDSSLVGTTIAQNALIRDVAYALIASDDSDHLFALHIETTAQAVAKMSDLAASDARSHGEEPARIFRATYVARTLWDAHPQLRQEILDRAMSTLRPWTVSR